jgi:hypothetical protein
MKLEDQIQEKLQELFTVRSIQNVNHNPHPYMIGPKHIEHAANNHGGALGKATLEAVQCAHPGCRTGYKGHTSDKVLFLTLKRNISPEEAKQSFASIQELLKENSIDGVTFIDTPEKFRIQSPDQPTS